MSTNQEKNRKISVFLVLLISSGLWFYSAFAQDINTNSGQDKPGLVERLTQFDNLLNIGVAAPLTALALTGATFLTRFPSDDDNIRYSQLMNKAKKNLIKSFVLFLACTIAIFIFDFIQLLGPKSFIIVEIMNVGITYPLLFAGFGYLAVAARNMYVTQAKK
jgi:hypothetical protein